ncbi:hypothetical protein GPJ56_009083 [Histomonas meleagridis]|uniref:uncharacterized protein n=1 Tax=Histomonas meleagridis TaxID=135588 RepID=UPI00355AB4E8|nr:hypothetical protein GPJ56_009083 [Histomonas meleagridis]KAH0799260.1 hypothetical protein GO595_008057 [Histomonas meleagridis]
MAQHMSLAFEKEVVQNDFKNEKNATSRLTLFLFVSDNLRVAIQPQGNKCFDSHSWSQAFAIPFGIFDYLISVNFYKDLEGYNPSFEDRIKECAQKLIDLLVDIDTHSHGQWHKHKHIWIKWSKHPVFFDIWCNLFEAKSTEMVERLCSQTVTDELFDHIRLLSVIIDFSQAVESIGKYASSRYAKFVDKYNDSLHKKCYAQAKLFIPKFPVYHISDFILEKALCLLEGYQDNTLLSATIILFNLSSFGPSERILVPYITRKLINFSLKALDKLSYIEKLKFLSTTFFLSFIKSTPDAFQIIPKTVGYFEPPKVELTEPPPKEIFSRILTFSSFQHFTLPSKVITALEKAADNSFASLASLWILMAYGDSSSFPIFNKILLGIDFDDPKNEDFVQSIFKMIIAVPYTLLSNPSKLLSNRSIEKFTDSIPSFNSETLFYFLVAMIEIIPTFQSVSGMNKIWLNFEKATQIPEMLSILRQCKSPRIRVTLPQAPNFGTKEEIFSYKNRIYSIYDSKKTPFSCVVLVRDKYGASLLQLNELHLNKGIEYPQLPKIQREPKNEVKQRTFSQGEQPPEPSLKVELPPKVNEDVIESEITLPPYGQTERKRSVLFEVIRSLNFVSDPKQIRIFTPTKSLEEKIERLDHSYPVPIVYIPVYYIDQSTTSYPYSWENEIVSMFLLLFSKKQKPHVFMCSLQSVRLAFVPYNYKRVDPKTAPVSFILNMTGFELSEKVAKDIQSPTVISVRPIQKDCFFVRSETKTNDDFASIFQKGIMVASAYLKGHIVYLIMCELLKQGPTLFAKGIEQRKEKIAKIISSTETVSALQYMLNAK